MHTGEDEGIAELGGLAGEFVFTPSATSLADYKGSLGLQEDDGYISSIIYVTEEDASYYKVYDAKTLALVASVKLPHRVPFGFHAAHWSY